MALLRAAPIETRNAEGASISNATYVSSPVRTGHSFALRTNPAGNQHTYQIIGLSGGGALANFSRVDPTYIFVWMRVASRPSANHVRIGQFGDCRLQMDTNGDIFLSDAAESADSAKVATALDTWIPLWILTDTSGTCALKVGTAAAVTVTGSGTTFANALLGNTENATFDIYWSDFCIFDDAADGYTDADEMNVINLTPNGAGASSGWTTGTGTTFAEVDEKPHDGDTTRIQTSTDNAVHLFTVQDAEAAGVTDTIRGVEGWCVIRSGGTANRTIIIRGSGGTQSQSTEVSISSTYQWAGRALSTDPDTAVAWTQAGLALAQIGCALRTGLSTLRTTAMGILVAYGPASRTVTVNPVVTYGSFTRTSVNNTPWRLTFTVTDSDGAPSLDWEVWTDASRAGTLVAAGTCVPGVEEVADIAYNADGLVNGNQTLYLHIVNPDDDTSLVAEDFTLKRDDDPPGASTGIEANS